MGKKTLIPEESGGLRTRWRKRPERGRRRSLRAPAAGGRTCPPERGRSAAGEEGRRKGKGKREGKEEEGEEEKKGKKGKGKRRRGRVARETVPRTPRGGDRAVGDDSGRLPVPDDDGPALLPEDRPAGPQGGRARISSTRAPAALRPDRRDLAERLKHKGEVVVAGELSPGSTFGPSAPCWPARESHGSGFVARAGPGRHRLRLMSVPGGSPPEGSRGALEADRGVPKGTAKFLWMEDDKGTATRLPRAPRK